MNNLPWIQDYVRAKLPAEGPWSAVMQADKETRRRCFRRELSLLDTKHTSCLKHLRDLQGQIKAINAIIQNHKEICRARKALEISMLGKPETSMYEEQYASYCKEELIKSKKAYDEKN